MNLTCPKCGHRLVMDFKTDRVKCTNCDYIRADEIAGIEAASAKARSRPHYLPPQFQQIFRGDINASAQAAFDSGQAALYNGKRQEAYQCFVRAAEYQPDWVDVHLWAASASDDPKVRRDELGEVIAAVPNQPDAQRMLLILNGQLTPQEAAQIDRDPQPVVRKAEEPVNARVVALICPVCGGDLTEQNGRLECRFCGYSAPVNNSTTADGHSLFLALVKRKVTPVRWNVGQRLIKCQQCGAEQTVLAEHLSQRCRFCGSTGVVVSDALNSFTKPEELIPFHLDQNQAEQCVTQALHSFGERLMSLFKSNQVEEETIQGVYLPFWVFDVTLSATRVKSVGFNELERNSYGEMQDNLAICGVKSPPRYLTAQLGAYDFTQAVAYEPKWLAKFPAQIYSMDFDDASLEARFVISEQMKRKYALSPEELLLEPHQERNSKVNVTIYSDIQDMTFRLALLPVWIATLIVGNERRLAVVNGQTGKTGLGKPG